MRFGDCDKLADKRRGPVPAFGVRTDAICLNAQVVGVFGATENVEIAGNNCGGKATARGDGSARVAGRRVAGRCCDVPARGDGGRACGVDTRCPISVDNG